MKRAALLLLLCCCKKTVTDHLSNYLDTYDDTDAGVRCYGVGHAYGYQLSCVKVK